MAVASRVGGTGRRDGLKHHCPKGRVGSNPTPGTFRRRRRDWRDGSCPSVRRRSQRAGRFGRRREGRGQRRGTWGRRQDDPPMATPVPETGPAARPSTHVGAVSPVRPSSARRARLRGAPGVVSRRRVSLGRTARRLAPARLQRRPVHASQRAHRHGDAPGQARWQTAHTTSHFASSASKRSIDAPSAAPLVKRNDLVDGSRWS